MSDSGQSMTSLLECPICLGPFTDPRMLTTCFHTLCYKCLSDHITHSGDNGLFQCPVCRTTLHIPTDGASAFPKNFFVNSCMAVTQATKAGEESLGEEPVARWNVCSNSEDGDDCAPPDQFCIVCCRYFCKDCSKAHQKDKVTRRHAQVSVDDLTDEMWKDTMSKSVAPRCQKHNKKLKLYCSNCKSAVCAICCHTGHQSHTFREVADVDEDHKTELSEVIATLQSLIEETRDRTNNIKEAQERRDNSTSAAKETTAGIFKKMEETLHQKAKEIDQKICKRGEDGRAETDIQTKCLTVQVQHLESLLSFAHDLLHKGSTFNRLASLPQVRTHLQQVKDSAQTSAELEVPSSAELIVDSVNSWVLEEQVDFDPGAPDVKGLKVVQKCSITPDKVDVQIQTQLPKLRVVMYVPKTCLDLNIDDVLNSLARDVCYDVSKTKSTRLKTLSTHGPQVDVIGFCYLDKSPVTDYKLNTKIAEKRRLVLLHESCRDSGSITETLAELGDDAGLFERVIHYSYEDAKSCQAAVKCLSDYFYKISRQ